ncbi:hypothetical protein GCM10010873_16840 [Cypionkella aquatica]|uniref:Capsule polysaccharide biosynthesis protein n=1 Tax=Cypionkella aquatica TaxID=1756042 RepID=A0AA37TQF6_9RHOB|nr:hypothetical protein [Cypionkella aquatica]GLS85138.1 hypothetical protein GCM10010873_01110 [Cypionkella aquatica]GLS86710.1 hypothetical protein GCM10010873_16840 [Cypionkella aquatica]
MVAGRAGFVPLMLTAERLADLPPTLFFHARAKLALALEKRHFKLLSAFADHALAQGWQVQITDSTVGQHELAASFPQHLHVFMEDRGFYARNIFHCVPSYLRGFWFFDQIGVRNNSLQRLSPFDAEAVPKRRAERFLAKLAPQFVEANRSKFDQMPRGAEAVPAGCLAFFAQDFKPPKHHTHYLSVPAMIEAAIAAKGSRAVYIKPHPNQSFDELELLSHYHDPEQGVHVGMASIHDLLAACDCAVTLSSAVGFEAFLHQKPVVLGGQTDFWQNAITLTDAARMPQALAAAMARDWPHAGYLQWYLQKFCLEDRAEDLPRLLARVHQRGYALGDLSQTGYF